MLVWLTACEDPAHEERLARMEARLDALEAAETVDAPVARPPEGPTPREQLDGLQARLDALGPATPAPAAPAAPTAASAPLSVDADGRVAPSTTTTTAEKCAYDVLTSVRTAELAYDAAFDGFSPSIATIGWDWDHTSGCDRMLAFRPVVGPTSFSITAVITRGEARARRFEIDTSGAVYERARYAAEELREVRQSLGWYGREP